MTNRKLKAAAVLEFGSQVEAAKALGLSEPRLARLINGRAEPKPIEIKLFRDRLGVELQAQERECSLKTNNKRKAAETGGFQKLSRRKRDEEIKIMKNTISKPTTRSNGSLLNRGVLGHSVISEPMRKTSPASQMRFTSGFTKTRK